MSNSHLEDTRENNPLLTHSQNKCLYKLDDSSSTDTHVHMLTHTYTHTQRQSKEHLEDTRNLILVLLL
jgi:hypothetical protein